MVPNRFVLSFAALIALACPAGAQQVELIDFYSPSCGPCRMMNPVVDRLEAEGVVVRRVDGTQHPELVQRLQVQGYPTFVLGVDGKEAGRVVGATSYEALRQLVDSARPEPTTSTISQAFAAGARPTKGTFAQVGGDLGPGQPAPTRPVATVNDPAAGELLARAVRLTIAENSASSYGTGTIIDARSGEALVVTCAHLFKGANDQLVDSTGRLSIELFDRNARVVERVEGQLVSHDFESDVALVAIRPNSAVQAAPVASSPNDLRVSDATRSVGCDLGADPTVREHRVVDLNRYQGPPNIEASGAPIQGRSGGGLFNQAGELVGICNFADDAADEGIYAGLASIHAQLDKIGMTDLYRGTATAPVQPVAAGVEPFGQVAAVQPPAARELEPVKRTPIIRGQNALPSSATALTPSEQATLGEIASRSGSSEVTVLIHPQGGGRTEVLTLDAASPEFVGALKKLGVTR